MPKTPLLSVVVAIVSDTTDRPDTLHLEPCLEALLEQRGDIEILVPYHPAVAGIESARRRFPGVRFIEITDLRTYPGAGSREHHDVLRARGLAEARGEIVALIEDHGIPGPGWSTRVVECHKSRFAAVGGAIENGIDHSLNWAVYFCDFLRYQTPLPSGESAIASDANVSYKRASLEAIRPVWRDVFHETAVNTALTRRGEKLALAPEIVLYQHRQGLNLESALRERYVWGRSYAAARAHHGSNAKRLFWAIFSPALPFLMVGRMSLMAFQKHRTLGAFLRALPYTAALAVGWSFGELAGYLTGRANVASVPATEAVAHDSQLVS